jgi:uncharacterized protein with FMN-binding domain
MKITKISVILALSIFLCAFMPVMAAISSGSVSPKTITNDGINTLKFKWDLYFWSGKASYYTFSIHEPGNSTPLYIQYSDGAGTNNFPGISGPLQNVSGIVGSWNVPLKNPEYPGTHNWTVPISLPSGFYYAMVYLYVQGNGYPAANSCICFEVVNPKVNPGIKIKKYTNGEDADDPPGPYIAVGESVIWEYVITNTGNVDLSNIVVLDDNGTPGIYSDDWSPTYLSGDDGDKILQTNETWFYQTTGTADAGQYENIANVSGWYRSCDICGDSTSIKVCDSDISHYYGYIPHPEIDLEKYVNGEDADSPTGPVVSVGSVVTFNFEVINIGDVDLTNVVIEDNVLGHIGTISKLVVGASKTFPKTISAKASQHTNTATVTTDQGAEDTDDGNYYGEPPYPGIDLEKYVNGEDADSPTGPVVSVGSVVTFDFEVINIGDVDLTNVVIKDNVLGSIGTIPKLVVGASKTFTKTISAKTGQHTNTATVTTDQDAKDTDDGNYYGELHPEIDLEKYVNGEDADSPTGPVVSVGSDVTFDFVVTNIGEVDLTNVVIEDDIFGPIVIIQSLPTGDSETFTITVPAEAGQHTNTATVTTKQGAEDTDDGNYFGQITEQGRWTGGGTIGSGAIIPRGARVTHGFELHNDLDKPNNLEVNWGGNKFHLTELLAAQCFWNNDISSPNPPAAPVNEIIGSGVGRYNGRSGYTIEFDFTDAGEPGVNDHAYIKITAPNQSVVLLVEGYLNKGNHQAHRDNN